MSHQLAIGNILQGRWICCNQQKKDSFGCKDTDHIDVERKWNLDSNYGTYAWNPV